MNNQDQQLKVLERMIKDIREAKDIPFAESFKRQYLEDIISAGLVDNATSNENTSTTVSAIPTTVNHPAQYDKRVKVEIDGTEYYIGLYNL
jgi:hypothetical protein